MDSVIELNFIDHDCPYSRKVLPVRCLVLALHNTSGLKYDIRKRHESIFLEESNNSGIISFRSESAQEMNRFPLNECQSKSFAHTMTRK